MAIYIYTYMCVNPQCRNIEMRSGVKYVQIDCDACGNLMRLIKEEKQEHNFE